MSSKRWCTVNRELSSTQALLLLVEGSRPISTPAKAREAEAGADPTSCWTSGVGATLTGEVAERRRR
ncbi:hypothetical protein, partial [Salmonella enterica]|uniref:hypothetical protein n=1 Tax=Salmonella enterica TaxID=28901 RepID=UPI002A75AF55